MHDIRQFPAGNIGRWIQWATTIAIIPLLLWVISIDRWRASTEANRWTIQDEYKYQALHEEVHKSLPPESVRIQLLKNTNEIEELRDRLTEIRLMLALLLQKQGIKIPEVPE